MRVTPLLLGLVLIPAAALADPVAPKWEQINHEDDVTVYSKDVPGSDIVAFRGKTVIDAPIGKVLWVLMDNEHRTDWVDRLAVSRVLDKASPYEQVLYQSYGLPWFMSDRDFVYRGQVSRDAKGRVLLMLNSCEHPDSPATVGVRGKIMRTFYVLTSVEKGTKTRISIDVHTDPCGMVPDFLVNMIQKSWPVKTLNGIRDQVTKPHVKRYPLPPRVVVKKKVRKKGTALPASTARGAIKKKSKKKKSRKRARRRS